MLTTGVIDAHMHFDRRYPEIRDAFDDIDGQLQAAGIEKGLVLHLQAQPYTVQQVGELLDDYERIEAFVNIDPFDANALADFQHNMSSYSFCGLKLHPRLQNFSPDDEKVMHLCRLAGDLGMPVLLDAFPDGTALMQGFDPLQYACLAKQLPQTRFIWAHMGGHKVIDMMMLAKRLPNVYMDCSFSLLYYRGSSVVADMLYAMKSMRYERIFYGSDYPDRSVADTLIQSRQIFADAGLGQTEQNKIFYQNAREFFAW